MQVSGYERVVSLVKVLEKQNPAGYNRLSISTTDRLLTDFSVRSSALKVCRPSGLFLCPWDSD